MIKKKPLRHNTIVKHKNGTFYGRIIKSLPDDRYLWLCCGYHFRIDKGVDLIVNGYKGTIDFNSKRFVPMTSLRNLKRRARRFHYEFAHNTPLNYVFIRSGEIE